MVRSEGWKAPQDEAFYIRWIWHGRLRSHGIQVFAYQLCDGTLKTISRYRGLGVNNSELIMAPDQPGGYFSTFSILDSSGSTDDRRNKGQRRNRKVSVCIPCHRRKLKCDKGQPCSRCSLSGSPEECVYQEQPSTEGRGDVKRDPRRNDTQYRRARSSTTATRVNEGLERRLQGVTHWRTIASDVWISERKNS